MSVALRLPFDSHRTPSSAARAARREFLLPPAEEARVLAAFGILLSRYSAQATIPLDVARPARWTRRLELRTPAGSALRDVLEQAEAFLRSSDADAGRDAPRAAPAEGARAALTLVEGGEPRADELGADLHLFLSPSSGRAAFAYDAALFKPATIERLAGHLRELLAGVSAAPGASIASLPLLTAAERLWIESVCDGPARPGAPELVHRSFERWAAETPGAPAVRFRGETLTYRELNARANAVARRLAAAGLGAEDRVVVCLEPSFDVLASLLGVLKAGAAYVPLDPGYPAARIRACLEDIEPRMILTRPELEEKVSAPGVPSLDPASLAAEASDRDPGVEVAPGQTAYVYFTSGTTGKPKGAAASQANLASYIRSARERYAIGTADVMPAIARFSFSISMFELMSPLAAGGTLLLLEREHVLDLDRMAKTLEEVTFFHAGPSLLKHLLAHIRRRYRSFEAFARVRHASSGGDMVPPELLEALKEIFAAAEVFVIYGCSEISCMGCTYPVPRDRTIERTFVGRPFDNVSVRVLDPELNVLPAGVVGEIFFAGDGVVKGYVNRPETTAERFLLIEGRRFYRTGDMGRLSEDGFLEILGRSDFQIKVRGMRIELGEIEHHLRRAAGVREGVVMTKRLGGDDKALVAYVVMDRGGPEPLAVVRRHMAEHLPDYMLPAAYVPLEKLPLNHNMKVDRLALPEPAAEDRRASAGPPRRAPETETEKAMAALWRRLLGVEAVGLDDHFFDLGGHSILGVTLIVEAEAELGVALTGMEVLRESLESLAAVCDRRLGRAPKPPAGAAARDDDFDCFHFGPGGSLYGVLSGTSAPVERAVLICPPVGQEHLRAHFVLRRLAQRLAAAGVPALRFDYYGCGDSLGESAEADCARWREDVAAAAAELKRRTGAARITAVGVRLGAALLAGAAPGLGLAGVVLWDPVTDGSRWWAETAEAHERLTGGWRKLLRPRRSMPGAAELLGLSCSPALEREIKALRLEPAELGAAVLSSDGAGLDAGWSGVGGLGSLLPDVGVSARLAALAGERA